MKKIAIIILGITFFISCKKKDNTTPDNTTNPATTTGAFTTGSGTMGNLQSSYNVFDMGNGAITKDSSVIATFFDAPSGPTQPNNIYAGVVSVNNTILQFDANQKYYTDTTKNLNMNQLSWNIGGSGIVAAFSYSNNPIYPNYTSSNIASLDTCIKANGISINLNGITNTNVYTLVSANQGSNYIQKYISSTSGSVVFSPSELVNFNTNSPINLNVFLIRTNPVLIGSVNYGITSTFAYIKFSYLK